MAPVRLHELQRSIVVSLTNDTNVPNPYGRRNLSPTAWGPPGWSFIDHIIEGWPENADFNEIQMMHSFITSLGTILPCKKCRDNHFRFTRRFPPDQYLKGRASLKAWFQRYKKMN